MKNTLRSTLLALLLTVSSALNINAGNGDKVENFVLKDYNGTEHSLSDYKDSKAIVLLFVATQCPVSNAYNSRMAALHEKYSEKEIAFIGINSNKQEDAEEVKNHAEENGLNFPILKDPNNIIADKFKAQVTPEIFVLSPEFEILYHGRIDDSQRETEITSKDLEKALEAILDGEEIPVKTTKAFGCTIKRV
ncbi:MAG: thioredoxin family protein [Melioribacteraceae bacterium]|nr:thioredoxin family protein [Melioribacteraceae bacterium]MDD3558096.1 thioredoxin family protein [Melioribacteraceae bacterium]